MGMHPLMTWSGRHPTRRFEGRKRMSAPGTKRTNFIAAVMSAYDPIRTWDRLIGCVVRKSNKFLHIHELVVLNRQHTASEPDASLVKALANSSPITLSR